VANSKRSAKDLVVAPIKAADAIACIKRLHYSHTIVKPSQLHFGVFLDGMLEGALSFGPPLDKRKMLGFVRGTGWNGFLELNRLAFSDKLPRNSESRALGVALRSIRKAYPHIEWIVSYADATQCGDGTIYRAAGFVLTAITKNRTVWIGPGGARSTDRSLKYRAQTGGDSGPVIRVREAGWRPMPGFQMRYIFFLNQAARERLTVPEIPFSRIDEIGAGMYRGVARGKQAMAGPPVQRRGSGDLHAPNKKNPGRSRG
jgi:hypothetical protein